MLTSQLFAGDALLDAIAQTVGEPFHSGMPRISGSQNRTAPAVRKIQRALLDTWDPDCLPRFGADGEYGGETADAVERFKVEVLGVPPDEVIRDVGPLTVITLDERQAALERSLVEPQPQRAQVEPEEWLLDAGDMGAFRSPAFTRGNAVDFMVDGAVYMESLAERFDALGAGDRVLLAGWRFSPEQRLRPTVTDSPGIQDQLLDLHRRGVKVRALVYGSQAASLPVRFAIPAFPSKDNFGFWTSLTQAGMEAVLDARLAPNGSHHQKCVVVQGATQGDVAFVGGIDICLDRWDNAAHTDLPARQREPSALGFTVSQPGWHDVQCALRGPAVAQVWQALADRWNDPTQPRPSEPRPVTIDPSEAPAGARGAGTQAVQVLRTLACNGVYSFLPGGERTVQAAYRKAIRRARHYIYLEDQYLWTSPLTDDLRDAAARGVQVILVVSRDFDVPIPGLPTVHRRMREETLTRVAAGQPGNVHFFHLQQASSSKQVYVHAKLMIVDDLYVAAGSANLNFRSHTTDSELHLGVFDTELVDSAMGGAPTPAGRSIRDLRTQVWGEHLNEQPNRLEDPLAALALMPQGPGDKRGHLVRSPIPAQGGSVDFREALRELLRTLQQLDSWDVIGPVILGPFALPATIPGFDLGVLVDLVPDPERFLRNLLNPHTICS